jgi:cold shock CspA family protein
MRGEVICWKRDDRDGPEKVFGWGFIIPDGKNSKVYFNTRAVRYTPVRKGDVVEFELFEHQSTNHPAEAAFKVERAEPYEHETETSEAGQTQSRSPHRGSRSREDRERGHIETLYGADDC